MVRQPINLGALGRLQGPRAAVTARPADTFFQPTRELPEPQILNLAPLSATLTDFLAEENRKRGREGALAGKKFAVENPELVNELETEAGKLKDPKARRDFLKKRFDQLQRDGKIPSAADPFFQIGYARAAARSRVGEYQRRVQARLDEAAQTRDEDGEGVLPAEVDQILAEEWAAFVDSPSVTNTYGQEIALAAKEAIDADFRAKAAKARGERMEREFVEIFTGEISQMMEGQLGGKATVTSFDLTDITNHITNEARAHNVQDVRGLVAQAAELSIERARSVGGDEMARTVRAWQSLVVGNQRLGDDATGVGARLEKLAQQADDLADTELADSNRNRIERRRAAQLTLEDMVGTRLLDARERGEPLATVRDDLIREMEQDPSVFGTDAEFAAAKQHLFELVEMAGETSLADPTVSVDFDFAMADRDLEAARLILDAARRDRTVDAATYRNMRDQLREASDLTPFLERNPSYSSAVEQVSALRLTGFEPEIQGAIDDEIFEAQRELKAGAEAALKRARAEGVDDELGAVNDWLRENAPQIRQRVRESTEQRRADADEVVAQVGEMSTRMQDAGAVIDRALADGKITLRQAADLRARNAAEAARFSQFENLVDYRLVFSEIENFVGFQVEEGSIQEGPDQARVTTALDNRWKAAFRKMAAEVRADETVSPGSYEAEILSRLPALRNEFLDEAFPGDRARIEKGLQEGESAAEAVRTEFKRDRQTADQLARTPAGAITVEALGVVPDPSVDPRVYQDAIRWQRGETPLFGSRPTQRDSEGHAWRALNGMDEALRESAARNLIPITGITPGEVLADRRTVRAPERTEVVADRVAWLRRAVGSRAGLTDRVTQGLREELERLEADVEPIEVSLEGYEYRPFTTPFFPNQAALDQFQDTDKWIPFLERLGVDTDDEDEILEFVAHQANIIDRTQ